MIKISLDASDFEKLVKGEVLEFETINGDKVQIILNDIGYAWMSRIIGDLEWERLEALEKDEN